jgi:hypothetical protein
VAYRSLRRFSTSDLGKNPRVLMQSNNVFRKVGLEQTFLGDRSFADAMPRPKAGSSAESPAAAPSQRQAD